MPTPLLLTARNVRQASRCKSAGVRLAWTTVAVTKEIGDLCQFPPVSAAATLLLVIFDTIDSLQKNKTNCLRLAKRAAAILLDLSDHMHGRWDDCPPRLLRNLKRLEGVLESISEHMHQEAGGKWHQRLMRRSSTEDALSDLGEQLDDAARSFQMSTLIDIHYSVGDNMRKLITYDGQSTSDDPIDDATTVVVVGTADQGGETSTGVRIKRCLAKNEDLSAGEESEALVASPVSTRFPSRSDTIGSIESLSSLGTARSSVELVSSRTNTKSDTDGHDAEERRRSSSTDAGADPASDAESRMTDSFAEIGIEDVLSPATRAMIADSRGFPRYHQSQITLRGKSRIKRGWWAGSTEEAVGGEKRLLKRYDDEGKGKGVMEWVHDVKFLQSVYHPNLPQLVGFSTDDAPVPFIVLSNTGTATAQSVVLTTLSKESLVKCAELMLRFYKDMADTALYIRDKLDYPESHVIHFMEKADYRVEPDQNIVVGLPPPLGEGASIWQNYDLAHALMRTSVRLLPHQSQPSKQFDPDDRTTSVEVQRKVSHLVSLAEGLLPRNGQKPGLSDQLRALLKDHDDAEEDEDEDEDNEDRERKPAALLTLRHLRLVNIAAGRHNHYWRQMVTAYQFAPGDIGYIPEGKDSDSFVKLGNVFDASIEIESTSSATQWCWELMHHGRQDVQSMQLPFDITAWPIVVQPYQQVDLQVIHQTGAKSVSQAWSKLLDAAADIGREAKIKPENLILIARTGTDQHFYIKHCAIRPMQNQAFGHHHMHAGFGGQPGGYGSPHAGFGGGSRGGYGGGFHHQQPGFGFPGFAPVPQIFYLFTSPNGGHKPYCSPQPMHNPNPASRPELPREYLCSIDRAWGYVHYIQLHSDDFT